ncbi:hypothetical protein HDV01_003950 [Terramyces sp. JEL0728]|nr:hypothetical protein HDV01_003950 [Terramyces sp. JEL0728]
MERKVDYLVKKDPLQFLPSYCVLNHVYEQNGYPLYTALPLRKSMIQSHVIIDFTILCQQILKVRQKDVVDKSILWSKVFKTNTKAFKAGKEMVYTSVSTDGVGVSVHLENPNVYSKKQTKAESKAE